jgi:hypothetical protein
MTPFQQLLSDFIASKINKKKGPYRTQEEFCAALGIGRDMLRRYKLDPTHEDHSFPSMAVVIRLRQIGFDVNRAIDGDEGEEGIEKDRQRLIEIVALATQIIELAK